MKILSLLPPGLLLSAGIPLQSQVVALLIEEPARTFVMQKILLC
jgi:hypothetical protein